VILTGDLNVGLDPVRQAYLGRHLLGADKLALAAEETECGQDCREMAEPTAVRAGDLKGAKSLIAFCDTISTLAPGGRATVFGLKPDVGMLSDHIGLAVWFRSVATNGPDQKG
jgi:hypothetical protein